LRGCRNELVEVFHLLFLAELGRQLDKQIYAVKGGCNLRFFFGSPRYSEALDLDVEKVQTSTLSKKVSRLLTGRPLTLLLATHELVVRRTSMPKQTDTTQRWKIELDAGDPPTPPGRARDPAAPRARSCHRIAPPGARARRLRRARRAFGASE
jgi:hypothetical protein